MDAADAGALAEGVLGNHAVDVESPSLHALLGLVEDGLVGAGEGLAAVLADEALTPVADAVLEDVDGAAEGADREGALFREEGFYGRDGGGEGGSGSRVHPSQKVGFLVGGEVSEELAEDCKFGGGEHFCGSL